MSLEDPFLIVQNEVFDALVKLRDNFVRWTDLQDSTNDISRDEYSGFVSELKNGLKSIQWDLDELEESLENGERNFKLDSTEFENRKKFIALTREEVKSMNERLAKSNSKTRTEFTMNFGSQTLANGTKYTRLINAPDASNQTDKNKSNFELDDEHKSPYVPEHSIVFDEAGNNLNVIHSHQSKLDRIRQLLHLTNERRLMAFGAFSIFFVVLIIIML